MGMFDNLDEQQAPVDAAVPQKKPSGLFEDIFPQQQQATEEPTLSQVPKGISPELMPRQKTSGLFDDIKVEGKPPPAEREPLPLSEALVTGIKNLPASTAKLAGETAYGLTVGLPETVEGLTGLATGLVQKVIPGEQESEKYVDAFVDRYIQRYGDYESAKRAFAEDPASVLSDFAAVLGGTGLLAKSPTLAKAASRVDPLVAPFELAGDIRRFAKKAEPELPPLPEVEGAKAARELGIELAPAQATRSLDDIRFLDNAARGTYGAIAQAYAKDFFDKQKTQIEAAAQTVGTKFGPPVSDLNEAAAVIRDEIAEAARKARRQVEGLESSARRETEAARTGIEATREAIAEAARAGAPPVETRTLAGDIASEAVKKEAARQKEKYGSKYKELSSLEGSFAPETFAGIGERIKTSLSDREFPIEVNERTPVASEALKYLDERISDLKFKNLAQPKPTGVVGVGEKPEIVGVNLKGLDSARKQLVSLYAKAKAQSRAKQDFTDQNAMQEILRSFDDQIETSIANGLFSGDMRALDTLKEARSSFAEYAKNFRPQYKDSVSQDLSRIVQRDATIDEIASYIFGKGHIGESGNATRLVNRLGQIFGRDSDLFNGIKDSAWNQASVVRNVRNEVDFARSANSIDRFANSSYAKALYQDTPEILDQMRDHARALRTLQTLEKTSPAAQRAEAARAGYEALFTDTGIGGSQATALRRIAEGTAKEADVVSAIFNSIASANTGNTSRLIDAIETITGPQSPAFTAMRQGIWKKLTSEPEGVTQPGVQKMQTNINQFLNGRGQQIAKKLYTPAELDLMRKYAKAIETTVIPSGAKTGSDTVPALGAMINGLLDNPIARTVEAGATAKFGIGAGRVAGALARSTLMGRAEHKKQKAVIERVQRQVTPAEAIVQKEPRFAKTKKAIQIGEQVAKAQALSDAQTEEYPPLVGSQTEEYPTEEEGSVFDKMQRARGGKVSRPFARAEGGYLPSEDYLVAMRKSESFKPKAYWDVKQYSIGYGTKAKSPDEEISQEEAMRRFYQEVTPVAAMVNRFAPDAPEGVKAALTSLTYNAGSKWMSSGLGRAIKDEDYDKARQIFLQYTKAGGKELEGLKRRRESEVQWFGGPPISAGGVSPEAYEALDATYREQTGQPKTDQDKLDDLIAEIVRTPQVQTVQPLAPMQAPPRATVPTVMPYSRAHGGSVTEKMLRRRTH